MPDEIYFACDDTCPRCGSTAPHMHPAVQFEGEVQTCVHDFHLRETPQNTPRHVAAVHKARQSLEALAGPAAEPAPAPPACDDCGRAYGEETGFPDLVVPDHVWALISPTGDEGGLLCPSCICGRLARAGIRCEATFASGPIDSVAPSMFRIIKRMRAPAQAVDSGAAKQ